MGEYATYRGESIKIGTCESMAMHERLCDSLHPSDGNGGWTDATQTYDVPTDYSVMADRVRQGYDPSYVAEMFPGVTV